MEYTQKDVIVGEQWLILSKIGEGSFGEVFKAQDINSKQYYAVKRESLDIDNPQLHHERMIYDTLAGGPCIPKCHWYGQHDGFDCIVIDLLGSSLKQLQETVRDIPLDIIIDLGCQLITCLEHVHDKGLVYRDIKPENFLFSVSCVMEEVSLDQRPNNNGYHSPPPSPPSCKKVLSNTSLYAVDFGLATWWRNPKTKKPYAECKKPIKYKTGTARYASLNVHRGRTHARRDDMESLGYLLLDLLLGGELPWSGVTARTSKAGWDRLKAIKEEILLQDMCLGLPHGIMDYIDYTRRLRFGDRPDYDYLRRLLRGCNETGPFSKLVTPHPYTKMIPSPPRYCHHQYNGSNNTSSKKENNNYKIKRRNSTASYKVRSNDQYHQYQPQHHHYNNHQHQHHQQQNQQQHEDVFIMDDLTKEFSSLSTTPTNNNNNNNNNATVKRSSSGNYYYRNHSNNNHYRHHSSSNSSQHRSYQYNKRYHNRPIGWSTHKNDLMGIPIN